jgi:hypothetical protein
MKIVPLKGAGSSSSQSNANIKDSSIVVAMRKILTVRILL